MALLGKQFMFFFFFFFFLFLSTHARNSQYFAQQVRQQNTNSKEHDDQENKFQPSFYKDTTTSYPHGIGAAATTPPPPLPDKPENLPSNYDANSYTTRAEHSTVNQQYQTNSQDKTVAETYGPPPSTEYKPYGKRVSEKYQHQYDPNSYPNEQHNSYNNKYNTEDEDEEEEELEEEPANYNTAKQFYYKDMNPELNENHENNKKKKNDESEQPNTKKGNVFSNDKELDKYLAEEEDNNVSPQEYKESSQEAVPAAPTKYNPFQNPNYNPNQNPNYNPSGEYWGMSDTRKAGTSYNVDAEKFDNQYNYQQNDAKKTYNPYTQRQQNDHDQDEDRNKYQSNIGGVDTWNYYQKYKQQQAENSTP